MSGGDCDIGAGDSVFVCVIGRMLGRMESQFNRQNARLLIVSVQMVGHFTQG